MFGKIMVLLLILLFITGIVTSSEWPMAARRFLLVAAIPGLVLSLLYLLKITKITTRRTAPAESPFNAHNIQDTEGPSNGALLDIRELYVFLWILGFIALVWFLGVPMGSTLFAFLYLRLASGQSWLTTIIITLGVVAFVSGLLVQVFRLSLPPGLIQW
jgi:hypothetical protein